MDDSKSRVSVSEMVHKLMKKTFPPLNKCDFPKYLNILRTNV